MYPLCLEDIVSFSSIDQHLISHDFHSSSLSPVKRLLNESIDSNIEIIQMDEQECVLEIVDGVLTIVPKENSSSLHSIKKSPRVSSIASSISSPSLSEPEREDISSSSSSKVSSLPSMDELDLFSTPLNVSIPKKKKKHPGNRHESKTNPLRSPSIKGNQVN